jgi:hypothetical protein
LKGPYFAVIDPESPRYLDWIAVLGTDAIEVLEDTPHESSCGPEHGRFYRARLDSLDRDQLVKVAKKLAAGWGLPPGETLLNLLGEHGLPILAEDARIFADPDEGRAYFAERRIP